MAKYPIKQEARMAEKRTFRVAIERTYRDVSVQYVDAENLDEAHRLGIEQSRSDYPSPEDFGHTADHVVIECDLEEGYDTMDLSEEDLRRLGVLDDANAPRPEA